MVTRTTKTVLAGVTVLAIAGVGSGIAYAQSADPTAAPATTAAAGNTQASAKPAIHRRALLRRVEHGEVTVRAKAGDRVIDVQRGTVTAVDGRSITVRSADGFVGTYAVDPKVTVRKNRKSAAVGQVAVADRVVVFAVKNGDTATVERIGDTGPGK